MSRQPSLLGGIFIGVMSLLPVVSLANLLCCMWVIVGGLLTVYLQQSGRKEPVPAGEAASGGLLARFIGGVLTLAGSLLMFTALGTTLADNVAAAVEQMPQLTPELRRQVVEVVAGFNPVVLLALINLPTFSVFGTLGALLGLALFQRKGTPQL